MREVKRILGTRIMIEKLENSLKTESGLTIGDDGESLPLAKVVMVSKELVDKMNEDVIERLNVGDIIHYTAARESGKCRHNGKTHYIITIANAVAVVDE